VYSKERCRTLSGHNVVEGKDFAGKGVGELAVHPVTASHAHVRACKQDFHHTCLLAKYKLPLL